MTALPHLLIISGLDPSGGAGFIADVRIADLHRCRPVGVVAALTTQTSEGVRAVEVVPTELIEGQLTALLSDLEVAAVKIGMLGDVATAAAVARALDLTAAPVVWDPVLAASHGIALWRGEPSEGLAALARHLALVTPNADEARALTGISVVDVESAVAAGRALVQQGVTAALVKGGHLEGETSRDVLVTAEEVVVLEGARIATAPVHGTGCALSTALAAQLAHRIDLTLACRKAKAWVAARIASPVQVGRGHGAVL